MNNYVDPNNGAQKVTMLAFNTNTTQGSSMINQVNADVITYFGTRPTAVYLYQGGNIIASRGVTGSGTGSTSVVFDNLNTSNTGTTGSQTYLIKADYPAGTATNTNAVVNVTSVNYMNSNGNNQSSNTVS